MTKAKIKEVIKKRMPLINPELLEMIADDFEKELNSTSTDMNGET